MKWYCFNCLERGTIGSGCGVLTSSETWCRTWTDGCVRDETAGRHHTVVGLDVALEAQRGQWVTRWWGWRRALFATINVIRIRWRTVVHARSSCLWTHATQCVAHGYRCRHDGTSVDAVDASVDTRWRVEATSQWIDPALSGHTRQRWHIHRIEAPREAFRTTRQGAWDFSRPAVIGGCCLRTRSSRMVAGCVESVVTKRLHQTIELGTERRLKVGCRSRRCVHGVAFALPPFSTTVLEPHLT